MKLNILSPPQTLQWKIPYIYSFLNLPSTRQSEIVIKLTVSDMTSVRNIDFSQIFSPVMMWVAFCKSVRHNQLYYGPSRVGQVYML